MKNFSFLRFALLIALVSAATFLFPEFRSEQTVASASPAISSENPSATEAGDSVEPEMSSDKTTDIFEPVVVDLQMSIIYADFLKEIRTQNGDAKLQSFKLKLSAGQSSAVVESKGNGNLKVSERTWTPFDADIYFQNATPKDLRAKYLKSADRWIPAAAFFRNALWATSSVAEENQASSIELNIDFTQDANFTATAIVSSRDNVRRVITFDQNGRSDN